MKKYSNFVGIDVSKEKLDVSFFNIQTPNDHKHFVIANNLIGLKKLLSELKINQNETLFCFENTGVYSMPLACFFSEKKLDYWVVAAIEIKRSKGITRGKSDKADAKDIALYASTHLHKLKLSSIPEKEVLQLKLLLAEREKIVKTIKIFQTTSENYNFLSKEIIKVVKSENAKIISNLKKSLKAIEEKIKQTINENKKMKTQHELLRSIPGVGTHTANHLLATTRCFTAFNNWRQLACYAGVAPFEYSSGSSIRGRTKVSHMADKNMKSLLNMCALSAKKYDTQIKEYYEIKIKEGKNPMLVMNNIRAKLLSRIFAVVNRETPFVDFKKYVA